MDVSGMKRRRSESEQFESNTLPMPPTLSKDEVQRMVSQEVQSAIEQSDKMMKALMERIQEIDGEPRYSTRIKKLEAHVKKVKRRGDAVFAYIRQRGTSEFSQDQQQSLASKFGTSTGPAQTLGSVTKTTNLNSFAHSSGGSGDSTSTSSTELDSEGGTVRKPKEGFWQSLRSKKQIVDLTDEACRRNKKTHADCPPTKQTSAQKDMDTSFSPLEQPKSPCLAVVKNRSPEAQGVQFQQTDLWTQLPPFPDTPFPQQLPVVAATKNMPQKPVVKVARITNPQSIALLWNVEEEDPHAADMDCYYIYVTQQHSDGTFSKWKTMGVVKAIPLPMACRVSDHSGGKTLSFILVGKDIYGRYGPYSDVQTVLGGKT
ncbi:activating transcription factor 7-interacting protein 2 isoform X2 [Electrophorus electricus]|uniref:activating transcription factor 7-interacting protein 2 isoform X2 n=1 Tax=Electrophorus electricus TaxID=8005 RepID=UPI0015CFBFCB|nr:activating transcription factor 7-interacting protein 2 isoform X2 [Electrophorus electricus]